MSVIKPIKKPNYNLKDKYIKFLADGAKPKDNLSNPLNVFDDSNAKDKIWMRDTKQYLRLRNNL